ncbi:hypothetical protein MA16_Dca005157 [Dendrobium catenatum]|uniref:Uncharacterized protein n=1 Tax=Dendrobium catenatum TaxID=906689 RepID=A0A2I0VLE2_9ASPA|nr:hypothetical protein MA16_Dca005157 [Dendrobium catenatum]
MILKSLRMVLRLGYWCQIMAFQACNMFFLLKNPTESDLIAGLSQKALENASVFQLRLRLVQFFCLLLEAAL